MAYQSYDEPRTASRQNIAIQSTQNWKYPKSPVQKQIIAHLNDIAENRTANFSGSLKHAITYAPTNNGIRMNDETFSFGDVIDVINPLQHLPIVGTLYRNMTGDKLNPLSGIIGGALYGGPVGAVTGTLNAVSQIQTGKDIGERVFSSLSLSKSAPIATTKNVTSPAQQTLNDQALNRFVDDITTLKLASMPPKQIF